ncbi:MAG TPA: MOP flippase family protein [Tenuifilaceae bacterium]|nr:MOP flippase family protein [Tenuifilaceae bacterium]HOG73234.1 MOP flippase family protein [Tenuifilaceae bacterium]
MTSLRQKTVSGLSWSFIDSISGQGIQFIVGIILARMLTPREFGLIGMITIFIAVSESFINSGFSSALIRKKECTQADYSTVFFYNLTAGAIFFTILLFSAPAISGFFKEPELKPIIQVLGAVLIIDSATIIQRTILTKQINFKLQTRISVIAALGSGAMAIGMAYSGFGVWSLVAQRLCKQAINSFLLWLWNKWKPIAVFSRQSFRELFGFGSKLLASGLIDTIYRNVYYLIIGKFFSAKELGYYTRADQFNALPSQSLTGVIGRVSYPILSSIQDDANRLKASYQQLIRSTMFITFILMVGMAAVAEPMVVGLIGEKWKPSIIYLQMLCFTGMLYPLHALNLNMLQVKGRSDLFLRLEVIKKILAVPVIVIGIFWGIRVMIAGMMLNSVIALYINSYWSGRMIGYPFRQQISDILPSFSLSLAMAISVYLLGLILTYAPILNLLIQVTAGAAFILVFSEMAKFKDYLFIKEIVMERLHLKR